MNNKKKILLLDSHAIIHRAFHGVPPLTTSDGTPVNAVYGYASTLMSVLEQFQPDYVVAAFDLPGGTFRHQLFPEYKANRSAPADDLKPQFSLTRELVAGFGIPVVDAENYEADDVIGTLAKKAEQEGLEVVIVTGDKDTFQLITDHISVYTMSRGIRDMVLYDAEAVKEKMGVTVEQVVDFKGICGDASDNIPGVKGIGEKGAQQLLGEYGTLDVVYENIDHIKPALAKKLTEQRELAFLSREIGTISVEAPVELDLELADATHISYKGARAVFQKFGFVSLLKKLAKKVGSEEGGSQAKPVYAISAERWQDYVKDIQEGERVFIVPDHDNGMIYGWGVCAESQDAVYVAHNKEVGELLSGGVLSCAAYDVKGLHHLCDRSGVRHPQCRDDVLLYAYAARLGKSVSFEHLVFDITGEDISAEANPQQMTLDLRDHARSRGSAHRDALLLRDVWKHLETEMEKIAKTQVLDKTVQEVYQEMDLPLADVLYKMESVGVLFDQKVFADISHINEKAVAELREQIQEQAGVAFNVNSTKQLREILFEQLQLPTESIKKTKTGYSTASSELEKLKDAHPIIPLIEKYRELFKLQSTYIDTLPQCVENDGRIHTTYHQEGTSTGRLSSSDPNLQNIPIRSETGRALRQAFIAAPGKKLVSADYSQIDLRCVAHVAEDQQMIAAFTEGADIHTVTAASVLGKDPSDISKEERSQAKELNFGLIYGMGPGAFAKAAGITFGEAKSFIEVYFKNFSGVKTYMENMRLDAAEMGYAETLFGRRYYVSGINAANPQIRAAAERAAINMPIQGLTADIMKKAMLAVDQLIERDFSGRAQLLLQIHDEVIVEADESVAGELSDKIKDVMSGVYALSVPLLVDAEIGDHWGQL